MKSRKAVITNLVVIGSLLVFGGCNSMGKVEHEDGRVEEVPQDVGVARAVAKGIENCKGVAAAGFISTPPNDCKISTGVADRAECFRSNSEIATMNILGLALQSKDAPPTCAESVASVGKSYMEKEAVQAKELGSGGKFVAGALATYGVTKEVVTGFVAGSAAGDTTVGTVNVNGSSGSGTGGAGAGTGGASTVNANIGAGNTINTLDGASQINSAEKQILNPTATDSGVIELDDSGDGSGNQAGIPILSGQ